MKKGVMEMKELPAKRGVASFKGTVADFREALRMFREFMEFVGKQERVINLKKIKRS